MQRGQGLRRGFGKDQNHERQGDCAKRSSRFPADLVGDDADERGHRKIDEVVAQENEPDQPVGTLEQSLCAAGAAVTLARLVSQLVTVKAHERRFRAREEGRKHQQKQKQTCKTR